MELALVAIFFLALLAFFCFLVYAIVRRWNCAVWISMLGKSALFFVLIFFLLLVTVTFLNLSK